MLVAKIKEKLAESKLITQRFHMQRFDLRKINEAECTEQYHVEISNRFPVSENLDAEVDINSSLETITENINISTKESLGYYKLKKQKPWFERRCLKLSDQRKQQNCSGLKRNKLRQSEHYIT
jgi:hypothetical protein